VHRPGRTRRHKQPGRAERRLEGSSAPVVNEVLLVSPLAGGEAAGTVWRQGDVRAADLLSPIALGGVRVNGDVRQVLVEVLLVMRAGTFVKALGRRMHVCKIPALSSVTVTRPSSCLTARTHTIGVAVRDLVAAWHGTSIAPDTANQRLLQPSNRQARRSVYASPDCYQSPWIAIIRCATSSLMSASRPSATAAITAVMITHSTTDEPRVGAVRAW
jgi:hypothetical protein